MHYVLVKSTKDVSLSKRQTTPPPIRLHSLLHWFSNCGPRRHFHVNHGRYRIIAAFQNIFITCVFYSFVNLIKKSFTLFKTNCFAKSVWCLLSVKLSPHTEVQCQFENEFLFDALLPLPASRTAAARRAFFKVMLSLVPLQSIIERFSVFSRFKTLLSPANCRKNFTSHRNC